MIFVIKAIMITMDERKAIEKKNRVETLRRIGAEIQYLSGVILWFMMIDIALYGLFQVVCFFVEVSPVIRLVVGIVLLCISAKCTAVISVSKGFNRRILNPKN